MARIGFHIFMFEAVKIVNERRICAPLFDDKAAR